MAPENKMKSKNKSDEILGKIFQGKKKEIRKYLVDLSEPKKEHAVPGGNVINVFLVIRADGELLIRHEGGEDISLATIDGDKYPIILNDKLISGWRRNLLEILRKVYSVKKDEINKIRVNERGEKKNDWFCSLGPTVVKKGNKPEERIGGLCTECPNCTIFGFAVQEEGDYNLKSRVEGDLSISTTPASESVIERTFNAVDEITHTTFIKKEEGERTGALFKLRLVKENTLFVGKLALKDLSPAELLLSLYSLVTLPRIGGNKSDFGRISIEIPAIVAHYTELGSGLDTFLYLKSKVVNMKDRATVISGVSSYANNFQDYGAIVVTRNGLSELIKKNVKGNDLYKVVKEAWRDGLNFKMSIESFIH